MKIVRFSTTGKACYGILDSDKIQACIGTPYSHFKPTDRYYAMLEVKLLPPCIPSKIVALGVNYQSHGEEMSHQIPAEPLMFIKPSTSVIGPEAYIVYPASSKRVDYEGELGVVIKNHTHQVSKEEAANHILGYTCVNDVTARDIQTSDRQWTRAKGFNTFCPIGPCIETELDPGNLSLKTVLNGEIKQQSSTSNLVFPVNELVSFISHVMTLLPGDVIATGTPSGIGPMQPGDIVEVTIENIGTLRNSVVRQ